MANHQARPTFAKNPSVQPWNRNYAWSAALRATAIRVRNSDWARVSFSTMRSGCHCTPITQFESPVPFHGLDYLVVRAGNHPQVAPRLAKSTGGASCSPALRLAPAILASCESGSMRME